MNKPNSGIALPPRNAAPLRESTSLSRPALHANIQTHTSQGTIAHSSQIEREKLGQIVITITHLPCPGASAFTDTLILITSSKPICSQNAP